MHNYPPSDDPRSLAAVLEWMVPFIVPAVAGFAGVLVGALLTSRREKRQRQLAFLEKQLSLFYSPMVGLRNEVRAQGRLRLRIHAEAGAAWAELATDASSLARQSEFSRIIDYDNNKLREDLLPTYQQMLRVFREHYWLATPATRGFYEALVEFVEIWERWVAGALPSEVVTRLGHTEANLGAFYAEIERTHDEIRARVAAGTP
jgi:hypothetical protein